MNSKNIAKSLNAKLTYWVKTIEDEEVQRAVKNDAMITGGALVSLLNGEKPNDYDVYFKTLETCRLVAEYYAKQWNITHKLKVEIRDHDNPNENDQKRIECFIKSSGVAKDENETGIDDSSEEIQNEEPYVTENEENPTEENPEIKKPKYRPRYFTTNAISLSDSIQLVIRFWGPVEEIHKNYDFEHCKCSYDWKENKVDLPVKALECIINKELVYNGSRYPLCSIIRTRKFLQRGYHINAGQYVKMALDLNELDLSDFTVFKDQLMGVDSAYFSAVLEYLQKRREEDETFNPDKHYIFEIINRIF